jgi:hypothetical protein
MASPAVRAPLTKLNPIETLQTQSLPLSLRRRCAVLINPPAGILSAKAAPAFTIKPTYPKSSPKATGRFKAYGSQDPFVVVHGPVTGSKLSHDAPKLSPTASSFTPLGAFGNDPSVSRTGPLGYTLRSFWCQLSMLPRCLMPSRGQAFEGLLTIGSIRNYHDDGSHWPTLSVGT